LFRETQYVRKRIRNLLMWIGKVAIYFLPGATPKDAGGEEAW